MKDLAHYPKVVQDYIEARKRLNAVAMRLQKSCFMLEEVASVVLCTVVDFPESTYGSLAALTGIPFEDVVTACNQLMNRQQPLVSKERNEKGHTVICITGAGREFHQQLLANV